MRTRQISYYRTRSIVRILFWGAIVLVVGWVIQNTINNLREPDNTCPVVLNEDFTWVSDNYFDIDVDRCTHPDLVILHQNGSWEWDYSDVGL